MPGWKQAAMGRCTRDSREHPHIPWDAGEEDARPQRGPQPGWQGAGRQPGVAGFQLSAFPSLAVVTGGGACCNLILGLLVSRCSSPAREPGRWQVCFPAGWGQGPFCLLRVGDSSRLRPYPGCRTSGLISSKMDKAPPSLCCDFPTKGSRCAIPQCKPYGLFSSSSLRAFHLSPDWAPANTMGNPC